MEDDGLKKRELEANVLNKVGDVISAIKSAKHVDQVICALYSIAKLLFPLDPSQLSGSIDSSYRDQFLSFEVLSTEERDNWWQTFYRGAAFHTLARFLLLDVASNWLACFPISAQKHVYDVFFLGGLATEVVQTLVPCLQRSGSGDLGDINAINLNAERLIVLCLLENNGLLQMAKEFGGSHHSKYTTDELFKPAVYRVAQIIASVPDKARLRAPTSFSSHLFFKQITIQLLSLAGDMTLSDHTAVKSNEMDIDGTLIFVGETFSRICRRGSADVLAKEIGSRVLIHIQSFILSDNNSAVMDQFESRPGSVFWLKLMEVIRDPYSVERMSEQILHHLATQHASDVEAYWILWLLFHRTFKLQASVRSIFVEKFLLWKVFPVSCLRWILQFAVLECPPSTSSSISVHNHLTLLNTVQRLLAVWSKREFLQTASIEQQAYLSAALGLSLEMMSKEELDEAKDVMHLILQGVSCRLESPNQLVRKMASSIALVFSKAIDPKNPLYLDDSCREETINWEFGFTTPEKGVNETKKSFETVPGKDSDYPSSNKKTVGIRGEKKLMEFGMVDPDEIIDPATLNLESDCDEDDDDSASENSESSSDTSLQPYDLSDDDSDLKKKISQLVDVVGALRKPEDADGVERALDVAEKLIRASPDELRHVAADLSRTLTQVRCSDVAVEGDEDSTEDKRQRALVALVVTCPFESLDTLNKLFYSPNVDISQRIMILDVMTEAAQELADSKTMKPKQLVSGLISVASETQPWFLPSSTGPSGAGSWKEMSTTGTLLNWSNIYERELPPKPNQIKKGKTRRWSIRSHFVQEKQMEVSHNKFPVYAAAFMLPAMEGFDKRRHGVDLLGRDFIVLGKLIHMLGVCMKSAAMHPEASVLAPSLLDMLRSREICHHKEAYVRRAVLFAASCILVALHPSYVASALLEGNLEISTGLEWIRTLAFDVAESDTDRDCYVMAMTCMQLHAEMALQTSRALESAKSSFKTSPALPSNLSKGEIKIPYLNVDY
ncbi:Telomere length regulation protein TEL2 like [Quillaja saponaria]|uniref:Telomere length regulation protein TEL2 like n=1 Tax=Quillaja saponaria TaxID=32244 RepID=A0AAD7KTJ4_QUISA|nr:Telomere length regulation protein TEL2 like [Quillaja saponaria]